MFGGAGVGSSLEGGGGLNMLAEHLKCVPHLDSLCLLPLQQEEQATTTIRSMLSKDLPCSVEPPLL